MRLKKILLRITIPFIFYQSQLTLANACDIPTWRSKNSKKWHTVNIRKKKENDVLVGDEFKTLPSKLTTSNITYYYYYHPVVLISITNFPIIFYKKKNNRNSKMAATKTEFSKFPTFSSFLSFLFRNGAVRRRRRRPRVSQRDSSH